MQKLLNHFCKDRSGLRHIRLNTALEILKKKKKKRVCLDGHKHAIKKTQLLMEM